MEAKYSKKFLAEVDKLPLHAVKAITPLEEELEAAKSVADIVGCKPLVGIKNAYRIRRGGYRILMTCENGVLHVRHILIRGQTYKKHNLKL